MLDVRIGPREDPVPRRAESGSPAGPREIPVGEIHPNPWQPRRVFDRRGLGELAESIRRHGVLQPLTVRRNDGAWELIAGERRLRAAKIAGLKTVPCVEVSADSRETALLALVENLQRQDLHYLEEAAALADYLRFSGVTQEKLAEQLGRSPSAIANKLRLLRLSPACHKILLDAGLTERHARCLLRLEDEEARLSAARHMAKRQLTVAQAERYVQSRLDGTPEDGRPAFILKDVRLFLNSLERNLELVRASGLDIKSGRVDTEDAILITIRIPKGRGLRLHARGEPGL